MGNVKTGKDSVVIGKVEGEIGEGSVVIGATDEHGNTILNDSMAVGRGASAGVGSIAIGAGASAGSNIFHLIDALKDNPEVKTDKTLVSTIDQFKAELEKEAPQQSVLISLWGIIQGSASVGGAINLVQQIGKGLGF